MSEKCKTCGHTVAPCQECGWLCLTAGACLHCTMHKADQLAEELGTANECINGAELQIERHCNEITSLRKLLDEAVELMRDGSPAEIDDWVRQFPCKEYGDGHE